MLIGSLLEALIYLNAGRRWEACGGVSWGGWEGWGVYYSQHLPSTTLNHAAIKKKKKKQTTLSGPHNARVPDDVICHLQLMKVMMTCMSAAYVPHLLGSTTLELLPHNAAGRERNRSTSLWVLPRCVWNSATCIPMTRHKFNHTFTPQANRSLRQVILSSEDRSAQITEGTITTIIL